MDLVVGLDWVLNCTTKFDATVEFYRDVLGLELTAQGVATVDTQFSRYAYVRLPDGSTLEIVEPNDAGAHLHGKQIPCLRVEDLLRARDELTLRGATIISRLFDDGAGRGWLYVQAPGGSVYQFYGPVASSTTIDAART
jgi:catechol 2,3-dioxygenase-like lactoylglutathione lyase family enzyme